MTLTSTLLAQNPTPSHPNTPNAEDKVNGRFWQGRFKCQLLRDERALLAAMTYVDLNPIRANMAPGLNRSRHTSVRARHRQDLRR